ncbi:hypothetical protein MRQ36_13660 [Micromonospora sp. R77]|nr:hypothetical protein [Micromonospora sp. R77]MCI4063573.1 hypothetical protein [Micromonospora sp. R77]
MTKSAASRTSPTAASSHRPRARHRSLPAAGSGLGAAAGVAGVAVGAAAGSASPASVASSGSTVAARVIAQPGSSTNASGSSSNRSRPSATVHRSAGSMSAEPATLMLAESDDSLLDEV